MTGRDQIVVVDNGDDHPNPHVKRQLGTLNQGVYCKNRACGEFIAMSVHPIPPGMEFEVVSEPPEAGVLIECWNCGQRHRYHTHDFENVLLTEENKRRLLAK